MQSAKITNKEIIIAGLRRQREILSALATALEAKELLDENDYKHYESVAKEVELNLKKLRRIGNELLPPQASTLFHFL